MRSGASTAGSSEPENEEIVDARTRARASARLSATPSTTGPPDLGCANISHSRPEFLEEGVFYLEGLDRSKSELRSFEHRDELIAVDKFDWWDTVPRGFFPGEDPSGDDQALVGRIP